MTESRFLQITRVVYNIGAIGFGAYGMRHTMTLSAARWCVCWLVYAILYGLAQGEFKRLISQAKRAERKERIAKRKAATSLKA
jgi:hypothetical protein